MALALVFLSGILFALGLGVSGMTQPGKVSSFLNIAGDWDPSLILVMLGASVTYFLGHAATSERSIPVLISHLFRAGQKKLGMTLVGGSALFGVGWGMIGLCPGPALVALVTGYPPVIVFVSSMATGMFGYNILFDQSSPNTRGDETLIGYTTTD